ncbi:unnamed protein product [Amoebophrya sp. A25]|nr:unnamed protein product [Amoebophrya sp. A25]|eukprot:GSA25T00000194001.1
MVEDLDSSLSGEYVECLTEILLDESTHIEQRLAVKQGAGQNGASINKTTITNKNKMNTSTSSNKDELVNHDDNPDVVDIAAGAGFGKGFRQGNKNTTMSQKHAHIAAQVASRSTKSKQAGAASSSTSVWKKPTLLAPHNFELVRLKGLADFLSNYDPISGVSASAHQSETDELDDRGPPGKQVPPKARGEKLGKVNAPTSKSDKRRRESPDEEDDLLAEDAATSSKPNKSSPVAGQNKKGVLKGLRAKMGRARALKLKSEKKTITAQHFSSSSGQERKAKTSVDRASDEEDEDDDEEDCDAEGETADEDEGDWPMEDDDSEDEASPQVKSMDEDAKIAAPPKISAGVEQKPSTGTTGGGRGGGTGNGHTKKHGKGVSLHLQRTVDFPTLTCVKYHDEGGSRSTFVDASDSMWLRHHENACAQILHEEEKQTGKPVFDSVTRIRRVAATSKIHDPIEPFSGPTDFIQTTSASRQAYSRALFGGDSDLNEDDADENYLEDVEAGAPPSAKRRRKSTSDPKKRNLSFSQNNNNTKVKKKFDDAEDDDEKELEAAARRAVVSCGAALTVDGESVEFGPEVRLHPGSSVKQLADRLLQLVKAKEECVRLEDDPVLEDLEKLRLIVCFFGGTLLRDSSHVIATPAHVGQKFCRSRNTILTKLASSSPAGGTSALLQETLPGGRGDEQTSGAVSKVSNAKQATSSSSANIVDEPYHRFLPHMRGRMARLYGPPPVNQKHLQERATSVIRYLNQKSGYVADKNLNLITLPFAYAPPAAWTKPDGSLNVHMLNVLNMRVWAILCKSPGMSASNLSQVLPFFDAAEVKMLAEDYLYGFVETRPSALENKSIYFAKLLRDVQANFL